MALAPILLAVDLAFGEVKVLSHLVRSSSLWPCGLLTTGLLCPWNLPGKNSGVGLHFPTQGSNPCLCFLHWQADSLSLVPPGKSRAKWTGSISYVSQAASIWPQMCLYCGSLACAFDLRWTGDHENSALALSLQPLGGSTEHSLYYKWVSESLWFMWHVIWPRVHSQPVPSLDAVPYMKKEISKW